MTEVVSKEIAIKEMQGFVEKWDDQTKEDYQIEQDYPQVIKAIQLGLLVIDDEKKPTYSLKSPIKTDEGSVALSEISFRTRIKPDDMVQISKGLNIGQQQIEYTLRCFAYITSQPKAMLNKLEKFDYKVIEQLCTIFL
jgi:hypothetical protein